MDRNPMTGSNWPNLPNGQSESPNNLETMSTIDLAEAMEKALEAMTEEGYDEAVIDAYMNELERRVPVPKLPDVNEAYAEFQKLLQESVEENNPQGTTPIYHSVRRKRFFRISLVAAIIVACVLGGMLTAQAAGLDVFATIAHWTEDVFRFGGAPDSGAIDTVLPSPEGNTTQIYVTGSECEEYSSIQDVLNDFGVTEVRVPTWFPKGYGLTELSVLNCPDPPTFVLNAVYSGNGGEGNIGFDVMLYVDNPINQVEKTIDPVEEIQINGITIYVVRNEKNYMASWVIGHYECYLSTTNKDDLLKMLLSIYD